MRDTGRGRADSHTAAERKRACSPAGSVPVRAPWSPVDPKATGRTQDSAAMASEPSSAAASGKARGEGGEAGRRTEARDQLGQVTPRVNRVPGEESSARDREAEEQEGDESLEGRAAYPLVRQGERVIVHEMREDRCADSVPEEQVAEPEPRDHARDDFPPPPTGHVREPDDRGAREEERPR